MKIGLILHGHSVQEFIEKRLELPLERLVWYGVNDYDFTKSVLGRSPYKMIAFSKDVHLNEIPCEYITESKARGNSMFEFLMQCDEKGVDEVYLFGADGYSEETLPYHKARLNQQEEHRKEAHKRDTEYVNKHFPKTTVKIFNVNNESKYTPFKIISYNTFIKRFK